VVDGVAIEESHPQVTVFVPQERLVVQTDVDQLFGTEHDAAGNRVFHRIAPTDDFLTIIDEQVVTGRRVEARVLGQEEVQHVEERRIDVVVGVDPHHELRVGRRDRFIEAGGQAEIRLVTQHPDLVRERGEDGRGSVGAAVVDDDDFVELAGESL